MSDMVIDMAYKRGFEDGRKAQSAEAFNIVKNEDGIILMANCSSCGAVISGNHIYCHHCGKKIEWWDGEADE